MEESFCCYASDVFQETSRTWVHCLVSDFSSSSHACFLSTFITCVIQFTLQLTSILPHKHSSGSVLTDTSLLQKQHSSAATRSAERASLALNHKARNRCTSSSPHQQDSSWTTDLVDSVAVRQSRCSRENLTSAKEIPTSTADGGKRALVLLLRCSRHLQLEKR